MLWLSLICEVSWLPSEPDLGIGAPSSASARLGRGLAEDTRLLVTELLRLTLFSRAEILAGRAFGSVRRCRESARPGID